MIADASDIVGSEYIQADKYLQDIVRDKRYWESKRQNIRQREKQMEETIARYQREMEELQQQRKEIIRQAKEQAQQLMSEANSRIENTISAIKEAQAEKQKTRQARQELTEFRERLEQQQLAEEEERIARKMKQLQERQERKQQRKGKGKTEPQGTGNGRPAQGEQPKPIAVGDLVKMKGQSTVGEVMEVKGKQAIVVFGQLKTTVLLERLERTNAPLRPVELSTKSTFVTTETRDAMHEKKLHFKQDLDVRGMRGDEAIQAVTYFIDDAILVGMARVRILHGTGTGILRTLIRQYLQTVSGVRHFQDEHVQFGGAGITVVDLN